MGFREMGFEAWRQGAFASVCVLGLLISAISASGQSPARYRLTNEESFDPTPQTNMRPIGQVKRFKLNARSNSRTSNIAQTSSVVRYTARQISGDSVTAPSLPVRRYNDDLSSRSEAVTPVPQMSDLNSGLNSTPSSGQTDYPYSRVNPDLAPVQSPRLEQPMANIDNCCCVSAAPSYQASGFWGCDNQPVAAVSYTQPGVYGHPAAYVPPPATIAPPIIHPIGRPAMVSYNNVGLRPLITLGQNPYAAQIGQGILGQPTAYVPGQYIRNFLRYLTP